MMDDAQPGPFRSHPYAGADDLERMLAICRAVYAGLRRSEDYHIGDILWQLFRADGFDAAAHIRLWEDADGTALGFSWVDEASLIIQAHPATWGDDRFEDAALARYEAERRTAGETEATTYAYDDDPQRLGILARRGYTRAGDEHYVRFDHDLAAPIAVPALPPGWMIRHLTGEEEYAERVALHHAVWPSRVTVDSYHRMRAVAGYTPDLDIVAVAPDGAFASYCICWYDPASRTGLFEPVGTHPAWRGQGLGKAVVREGLRRLRAHGAQCAFVHTNGANAAAIRLYTAAGFRIVSRTHPYRKNLPPTPP